MNRCSWRTALEEKKQHIKDVALQLFADKGYSASTMRDIARKGRISLGLTYRYFDSKEALLMAIVREGVQDLSKILRSPSEKAQFLMMLQDFFTLLKERFSYWRFFIQLMLAGKLNQKAFQKVSSSFGEFFHRMEEGFRRHSNFPAELSGAVLHGIIFEYLITGDENVLEKGLEKIESYF